MDGVGARHFRGGDDAIGLQIAIPRRRTADADGPIGQGEVTRSPVFLRKNADRLDIQFPAGAEDAERDLAAVGDQHAAEHPRGGFDGTPNHSSRAVTRARAADRPLTRVVSEIGVDHIRPVARF
jgi:hypothetical protein